MTDNQQALSLYRRFGFQRYGYQRRAAKTDNGYRDEERLMLELDALGTGVAVPETGISKRRY
jgi:RimJ/RimL family protein N-acetyltransferase